MGPQEGPQEGPQGAPVELRGELAGPGPAAEVARTSALLELEGQPQTAEAEAARRVRL